MTEPPRTRIYRGIDRGYVIGQYQQDARKAAEAGFVPTSESWHEENSESFLTVVYEDRQASAPTAVAAAPPQTGMTTRQKVGGVLTVLIGGLLVVGALRGPTPSTPSAGSRPAPVVNATPAPPAKPAQPQTLLTMSGNGIKSSGTFTAGGPWTLEYRYDCSDFGFDGNFIVSVYDGTSLVALPVNALGPGESDSTQVYDTGTFHLEVNSTCEWTVTAKG